MSTEWSLKLSTGEALLVRTSGQPPGDYRFALVQGSEGITGLNMADLLKLREAADAALLYSQDYYTRATGEKSNDHT